MATIQLSTAQAIVEALWKNGEQYHAGAIEHAEWSRINIELWKKAERKGMAEVVRRKLNASA